MDIWTTQLLFRIGPAFLLAWLLTIGTGVLTVHARKRPERRWMQRVAVGLTAVLLGYLGLFVSVGVAHQFAVSHRFASLVKNPPTSLVIETNGKAVTITDAAAIGRLLRMIDGGETVWAHHSYPIEVIHLSFPQLGYSYSLGRDSQRQGEYWLAWEAYPGSGRRGDLSVVRHFKSEELRRWLEASGRARGITAGRPDASSGTHSRQKREPSGWSRGTFE